MLPTPTAHRHTTAARRHCAVRAESVGTHGYYGVHTWYSRYRRPHALRGPHRRGARRRSPVGVGRSLQRLAVRRHLSPPVAPRGMAAAATTVRPNSRRRRRRFAAAQCSGPCAATPFPLGPIPLGPIPLGPFPLGPFPLTARFASAQPCHAIPFHSHGRYDTLPNALFCAAVAQRRASAVYASLC